MNGLYSFKNSHLNDKPGVGVDVGIGVDKLKFDEKESKYESFLIFFYLKYINNPINQYFFGQFVLMTFFLGSNNTKENAKKKKCTKFDGKKFNATNDEYFLFNFQSKLFEYIFSLLLLSPFPLVVCSFLTSLNLKLFIWEMKKVVAFIL